MTRKYLDLSTSHIKENNVNSILESSGLLFSDKIDVTLVGYPYEEGTFISIGEVDNGDLAILKNNGFEDVYHILKYCQIENISLIRFDRDAETLDIFKSYNW